MLPKHFEMMAVLSLLASAWFVPQFGSRVFGVIEKSAAQFAKNKSLAILAIAFAAILLRLGLLAFVPVPVPEIHDEFSYLLAADSAGYGALPRILHCGRARDATLCAEIIPRAIQFLRHLKLAPCIHSLGVYGRWFE
jgi:hypothetical protein